MSTVGRYVPQTPRDHVVRELLQAVRAFSDAMERMHSGLKGDMEMNATDVAALRMLVLREQRGVDVSPHDVARHLRISTASTTKLLDRLVDAGHVERRPHPHDRRALVLVLTDAARSDFHRHFGGHLRAMRAVAERYAEDELRLVSRFLVELGAEAFDPE